MLLALLDRVGAVLFEAVMTIVITVPTSLFSIPCQVKENGHEILPIQMQR